MRRAAWCRAALVLASGAWGCASQAPDATVARDTTVVGRASPQPAVLATVAAVPVIGFTGPGGRPFEITSRTSGSDALLHRQIGMRDFTLPLRRSAPSLRQYPCATCHQGARLAARRPQPFHDNVQPQHPRFSEGACTTCHVSGAVDRLALAGGAATTLDHAYRLCAQCHSAQVRDWSQGAHGKRLMAWSGRRVVMSCADCHDPHRPATESRVPFPGAHIRQSPGRGAH